MVETLDGVVVTEYQSDSHEGTAGEDDAAAFEFAEHLAIRAGGPVIRAVVLIGEAASPAGFHIIARYPRLVIQMGTVAALACSAPASWYRFLVVASGSCNQFALFSRFGTELRGETLNVVHSGDLANVIRLLNIDRCLTSDDLNLTDCRLREISPVGRKLRNGGISRFANELLSREGVVHRADRTSVAVPRTVNYSVIRPQLAVFDPREPSLVETVGSRPVLFVSERRVANLYSDAWTNYARQNLSFASEVILDLNESTKSWSQVHDICSHALEAGLSRTGIIVGIGGGVTLDVTGFAASVFHRGIGFVRIPTSLVGLIDVAVGIKQAVNSHGRKNLLGSFYPPLASINDYRFLATLPPAEISCGLAEILKMALLRDPLLLGMLESDGPELLASHFAAPALIAREVLLRAELLMMEELTPNLFEGTLSRYVDFGHTFSPAIETASHHRIPHGRAVAIDMLISTALGVVLDCAQCSLLDRLIALLPKLGLLAWDELVPPSGLLFDALKDIELHRGGSLNLVVVTEPGKPVFLQTPSPNQLDAALALLRSCIESPGCVISRANQRVYARTGV